MNNLFPLDARVGVSYLFTITRALACRSAAEAANAIECTPRLSGHNFHVADRHQVLNLECTATRVARTEVRDRPFVHANHYLDAHLKAHEFQRESFNSTWRQDQVCALASKLTAPISMLDCWQQMAQTAQSCVPQDETTDPTVATVATVAMAPGLAAMDVCAGVATDDNRQRLNL